MSSMLKAFHSPGCSCRAQDKASSPLKAAAPPLDHSYMPARLPSTSLRKPEEHNMAQTAVFLYQHSELAVTSLQDNFQNLTSTGGLTEPRRQGLLAQNPSHAMQCGLRE